MALEGPQLRYARDEEIVSARADESTDAVARALRLARQVEELLEATPSLVNPSHTHSTRMARAMAASLVDELEALVSPRSETPRSSPSSVPPPRSPKSGIA